MKGKMAVEEDQAIVKGVEDVRVAELYILTVGVFNHTWYQLCCLYVFGLTLY